MSPTMQALLAFPIVLFAAGYSLLKFMPKAWRGGVAAHAARLARQAGLSAANARRVEAKLTTGGACGSCDSCKACAAPAPTTAQPGRATIPIRSVR